uniref:ORF60 n=1 Tax=Marchantia paleacea TaxID=56867 RepID=Q35055_MARPA|nr:hypothetical protein MapooMp06 [Marchantia paleacea]AAC09401.1 ORF60 [Marchantia paleacea]
MQNVWVEFLGSLLDEALSSIVGENTHNTPEGRHSIIDIKFSLYTSDKDEEFEANNLRLSR